MAKQAELRTRIETAIEGLLALLDTVDGDENLEPEMAGFDPHFMDDREGDDKRDCDLAGGSNDLEHDEAYYDGIGFIAGGQGL